MAAGFSLTTPLRDHGDAATKARRKATKQAANARNKANQQALANWHRAARGKHTEIAMPERRRS